MSVQVLIVGGGLSGLALAETLEARGVEFRVLEARQRFGGRVLSTAMDDDAPGRVDLGPAWFWPHQKRMAALVARMGLSAFRQHAAGFTVLEEQDGGVRRDLPFALNPEALRIEGGLSRLIAGLATRSSPDRLVLGATVTRIERTRSGWRAVFERGGAVEHLEAERIVLAAPPRVLAETIAFEPDLSPDVRAALSAIPTWMAGHAKAVAVYDRPFWREAGLSGDAISRRGPLAQIHDASPNDAPGGALFGFFGLGARERRHLGSTALRDRVTRQLGTLFGGEAQRPKRLHLQDWAEEPLTATRADVEPVYEHPNYGAPKVLEALARGGLRVASTEVAPEEGGYLEGALAVAEETAAALLEASAAPAPPRIAARANRTAG